MRRVHTVPLLAGLALAAVALTGCWGVVKLVQVSIGNLHADSAAPISAGYYINLEEESSEYADHKDKFDDVEDVVVLGTFENNLSSPVDAEVWIVTAPSSSALLPSKAAVQAAGGTLAFSMSLAGNETKEVDWQTSADLFTDAGKEAVKDELEGDAVFTIYVFGSTGTYDVTVTNGVVAALIYIGVVGP